MKKKLPYYVIFLLLLFSYSISPVKLKKLPNPPVLQWKNCNNCYAVVSYNLIHYHLPKLNVTVKSLMQESHQTCAGGVPTLILNRYFPRGTKTISGTIGTVVRAIKQHGPVIINYGKGHLVLAYKASKHGVAILDPADGEVKIITLRANPLHFNYIVFPMV